MRRKATLLRPCDAWSAASSCRIGAQFFDPLPYGMRLRVKPTVGSSRKSTGGLCNMLCAFQDGGFIPAGIGAHKPICDGFEIHEAKHFLDATLALARGRS